MSISALQKITQIGILKAIGFNSFDIKKIFFYFSFFSGLIGVLIGIGFILIIQFIEYQFPFLYILFRDYPFLEFSIFIDIYKIFYICFFTIIALVIAAIYPANKASNFNPIYSIGMK